MFSKIFSTAKEMVAKLDTRCDNMRSSPIGRKAANVDQCGNMKNEVWAKHRTAAMAQGDKHYHRDEELTVFAKCIFGQFVIFVEMFVTMQHCGCSVLGPDLILYACKLNFHIF